ncbi:helix-turn-helix transcriptional regulator [Streptomyces sp. VRA16 Mangrove soil]|uniref:helix-turn-helix domain-containing protein n=1 Tax=Streptomyces sp. VRA16 Mangrove soil TaxID=2817434 RepID=UPI001A9D2364|nr:helix-turn-helix transcriptional regulator [Streptomyces sp. VRA16 Mangrove soil]MBO1333650.1 helix-turn-helix transcriptional regulator [Streptomyces sp. VRA16 Mangrove soil]
MTEATDSDGWELEPGDEQGAAVIALVGRLLKARREALGLRVPELASAMGYGEGLVYKVESGKRIPRPEFLDKAEEVLDAGGLITGLKGDVAEVRYPKRVRDIAAMEAQAVELTAYWNHNLHGLLQTPEYAQALISMWRPTLTREQIERGVAGRAARKSVFERDPAPSLSFIQEEVTLRRPIGGKMVLRRQLEHLLDIGQLPHVEIQVMPTDREDHSGMSGEMEVLKFRDGTAIGRCHGLYAARPVSDAKQLRVIELRCGIIRAQALPPGESLVFIEQVLGEL